MALLKLIALDEEDLKVFSTHLQDSVLRVGDMAFLPQERRFAALMNRFDWLSAGDQPSQPDASGFQRRRTALRFERVLSAQVQRLDLQNQRGVEELLAIAFDPADPPGGYVRLIFSGGGVIRLHVECIEAEMRDLGPAWKTANKPTHPGGGESEPGSGGGGIKAMSSN